MLELKEKAIILREEHLSHQMVVFGHFKKIDDVKISVKSLLTFGELYIFLGTADVLEAALTTTAVASKEVVTQGLHRAIDELLLV